MSLIELPVIAAWLPTPAHYLLVSVVAVLVYVLTTRARHERRAPAAAIAWVLGLALMPYVMLPLYLLFGQRKVRPILAPTTRPPQEGLHWAAELIESFGLAPPSICETHLHDDGEAARTALFRTIDRARERLDVCTFLIGDDTLGAAVIERLARKAKSGVAVRLLLDGFGAVTVPTRYLRALRDAGVEVAVFRPFFGLRRVGPRNLRNHRKLTIADNQWLWSGGRNFAAEYFTGDRQPPWLDLSFDLHGPVAAAAALQFDLDWASVLRKEVTRIPPPTLAASRNTRAISTERPGSGRRYRTVLADRCLLPCASTDRCDHTLLRTRRQPAHRIATRCTSRRSRHDRDSARNESPPCRFRSYARDA